jgi:hypothetical protein
MNEDLRPDIPDDEPHTARPAATTARRAALATADIPTGLLRMQRERMEKKARKGTLRAA